jgi:hypothetical protein
MNIKSLLGAAAISSALIFSGAAQAASAPASAKPAAAVSQAKPEAKPSAKAPAELSAANYAEAHKGLVAFLTRFKTALSDAAVVTPLTQLATELNSATTYQKAFNDATKAGDAAAAKAASDSYVQSAQKIIDLATMLNANAQPVKQALGEAMGELGGSAAKMMNEKDVLALIKDCDNALKPVDEANLRFGHVYADAAAAAKLRFPAEQQKLFSEELHDKVLNYLQGQWAQ